MLQDNAGSQNVECSSWEMSEVRLSAQPLSREVYMQYSHRRDNNLFMQLFILHFIPVSGV